MYLRLGDPEAARMWQVGAGGTRKRRRKAAEPGMFLPQSPLPLLVPFGLEKGTGRKRQGREKGEVCTMQLAVSNQVGVTTVEAWLARTSLPAFLHLFPSQCTYKIPNLASTLRWAQVKVGSPGLVPSTFLGLTLELLKRNFMELEAFEARCGQGGDVQI